MCFLLIHVRDTSIPTSYTNNQSKVAIGLHLKPIYLKIYLWLVSKSNKNKKLASLKTQSDLDEDGGKINVSGANPQSLLRVLLILWRRNIEMTFYH